MSGNLILFKGTSIYALFKALDKTCLISEINFNDSDKQFVYAVVLCAPPTNVARVRFWPGAICWLSLLVFAFLGRFSLGLWFSSLHKLKLMWLHVVAQ